MPRTPLSARQRLASRFRASLSVVPCNLTAEALSPVMSVSCTAAAAHAVDVGLTTLWAQVLAQTQRQQVYAWQGRAEPGT